MTSIAILAEAHEQALTELNNHKTKAHKRVPNYRADKIRLEAKCADAKKALDDAMLRAEQIHEEAKATRTKKAATGMQIDATSSSRQVPDRRGQLTPASVGHFPSAANHRVLSNSPGLLPQTMVQPKETSAAAAPTAEVRSATRQGMGIFPGHTNIPAIRGSARLMQSDDSESPRVTRAPYGSNASPEERSQEAAGYTVAALTGVLQQQSDGDQYGRIQSPAPASSKTTSAPATASPFPFEGRALPSTIAPAALHFPGQSAAVMESSAHVLGDAFIAQGTSVDSNDDYTHPSSQPRGFRRNDEKSVGSSTPNSVLSLESTHQSMTGSYEPRQRNLIRETAATPEDGAPGSMDSERLVADRSSMTYEVIRPPYNRDMLQGEQEARTSVEHSREMSDTHIGGVNEHRSMTTGGRAGSDSVPKDDRKLGRQDQSKVLETMSETPSDTEHSYALSAGGQSFVYPSPFRSLSPAFNQLPMASGPYAGNVRTDVVPIQTDQYLHLPLSSPADGRPEQYLSQQPDGGILAGMSYSADRETISNFSNVPSDSGEEGMSVAQRSPASLPAPNWQSPKASSFPGALQSFGLDTPNGFAESGALQGQRQGHSSNVNDFSGDIVGFDWHSQTLASTAFSQEDFASVDDREDHFEPFEYSSPAPASVFQNYSPQTPIRRVSSANRSADITDSILNGQRLEEARQTTNRLREKITSLHRTVQLEQASLLELEVSYNSRAVDFRSTLDKAFQIRKTIEVRELEIKSLSSDLEKAEDTLSKLDQRARDIARRDGLKAEDMKFVKIIENDPGLADDAFRELKVQRLRIQDELIEIENRLHQSSSVAGSQSRSTDCVANAMVLDAPLNVPAAAVTEDPKKRRGRTLSTEPLQKKRRLPPRRTMGHSIVAHGGDVNGHRDLEAREIVYQILAPDADIPTQGGRMTAGRYNRLIDKIRAKEHSQRRLRKPKAPSEQDILKDAWGRTLPEGESPIAGLTAEEYRELEAEGSAQIIDFLQTGDARRIDVTIRQLAREYQAFLPESSDQTRALAMVIHYTETDNHQCRYHRTNRGKKESDGTGKYRVEGVAYQADLASKKPRDHHMHCGCAIDDVLLEYYFWKRWKIRSRNPEVSDEEGMKDLIITPRHRAFIVQSFQLYTLLGIEDIYQWSSNPTKSYPLHVHLSILSVVRQAEALKKDGYDIDWLALTKSAI
ncbi:hypothetical protein CVT26_014755 [Gymnopilus dilepis]|uniref:Uncharacterized protein n=1 Tax=Gymnopilus dilepis TaxID=231916 RepID=A0A409WQZ0_9AGAR|nr:hypothetical protein CVT26_014755 [Gymnopilus dilepis]